MKNRLECMQPIRFLVVLLMCCLSYTTWAQTQSNVNGLVTDFSGEPLIGVSILVKGTSNGTVTDLDGKFSLSAEMGNMLQISYTAPHCKARPADPPNNRNPPDTSHSRIRR